MAELIADRTAPSSCASAFSSLACASSLANLRNTADDILSFEALTTNGEVVLMVRGLETKEVLEAALRAARRTKCLQQSLVLRL